MTTAKKILSTILSFIILAIVCLAIFIKNLMVGIVLAIIEATKKSIREAEDFFLKKKMRQISVLLKKSRILRLVLKSKCLSKMNGLERDIEKTMTLRKAAN